MDETGEWARRVDRSCSSVAARRDRYHVEEREFAGELGRLESLGQDVSGIVS